MTAQTGADRDDNLLTVTDIPGHIGAYEQTVRSWIARGELKASKFGTRTGYRCGSADYDDFLRRQFPGAIARQLFSLGANEMDHAT